MCPWMQRDQWLLLEAWRVQVSPTNFLSINKTMDEKDKKSLVSDESDDEEIQNIRDRYQRRSPQKVILSKTYNMSFLLP